MKEDHILLLNGHVQKEETNQCGPKFLVEWSCSEERINERGPYILVKWSRAHKKKSMKTLIFGRMVEQKRRIK